MGEPRRVNPDGSADPSGRRHRPPPRRPAPTSDPAPPVTDPLLSLQQLAGNRAVAQLVDRGATPGSFRSPATVQRQGGTPPATPAGGTPPAAGTAVPAPEGLIVEDDVTGLRPEQLTRSAFLAQARSAAAQGVSEGAGPLAARGETELQSTSARYSGQSAAQLEATVRREVAGAGGAASAAELINAIRTSSSVEARSRIAAGLPDNAVESAKDIVNNAGQAVSAIAGMLFKGRDDTSPAARPGDVAEARAQLGAGGAVPGGLRSEVEQATGTDLSGVRLHHGGPAATMAGDLGARAFTVGSDIVIGAGEPGPGTLHGDALLAHELAHAAQQSSAPAPAAKSDAGSTDLAETAADDVAAAAVIGERTGVRGQLAALGTEAARRIKLGLRLQRCGKKEPDPTKEDLNKKVLTKMGEANRGGSPDRGVHYPFNYQRDYPTQWGALTEPEKGHAKEMYWERPKFMMFVRRSGVSANAALDAFFAGPTIADCATVAVASQIAAVRDAIGREKFDRAFGSTEHKYLRQNLVIAQSTDATLLKELMQDTESVKNPGTVGHRNLSIGQKHYFANHPDYPKRHSTGFWQGENAVYVGEKDGVQLFTGFGAPPVSEQTMNQTLVDQYNLEPSTESIKKKKDLYDEFGPDKANWPADRDIRKFHGEGPANIKVEDLLKAGGGLQTATGQELDPAKVKALKDSLD